jgi:hypothetical protein
MTGDVEREKSDKTSGDELIHVREVAKRFRQPNGKPRQIVTVIRWILNGVKIKGTNEVVKLKAQRMGNAWYTTERAVEDFSQKLTEASLRAASASADTVGKNPSGSESERKPNASEEGQGGTEGTRSARHESSPGFDSSLPYGR